MVLVFRRWRHFFTLVGAIAIVSVVGTLTYRSVDRSRPFDVTTIGDWEGFAMPSFPLASATVVMLAIAYTLVVPGTPRTVAKVAATVVIVALSAARLYLAVDHPFDVVVTVALAVGVVVNMFRFCTPNEVFPVTYRRARSAHLDLRGRRGDAIRQAVRDQFGFVVTEIEPIGWQWSSASTPLRLCVGIDPDRYVFGKLYAMSHVRADRWYKLGKTLRYGRLEDEAPFQSVRRLVQNEDHMLRLLHDVGIKSARAIGIVRLGPLREYLLLTEYFDGATEINEAEVDDGVIDEGLALVRQLWTAGLAHRDIKPANLLIKDRHMFVIDVGLVEIAPTRWRQGVDLANMMLVLALSSDTNRVYRRALRFFSAEEIAEAFAAARGITCPVSCAPCSRQTVMTSSPSSGRSRRSDHPSDCSVGVSHGSGCCWQPRPASCSCWLACDSSCFLGVRLWTGHRHAGPVTA